VDRDPVEVLVSQLKHIAAPMLPGANEAHMLGLDCVTRLLMQQKEYCASVMAACSMGQRPIAELEQRIARRHPGQTEMAA
jgi:hypothetical protein